MKHKLTKDEVIVKLHKHFLIVNDIRYCAPDSWKPKLDNTINLQHFTHDFLKSKISMYIPFRYDNYHIMTYYLTSCSNP